MRPDPGSISNAPLACFHDLAVPQRAGRAEHRGLDLPLEDLAARLAVGLDVDPELGPEVDDRRAGPGDHEAFGPLRHPRPQFAAVAGDPVDREQLDVGRALDDHGDAAEHREHRAALEDLEPALRQDIPLLRDPTVARSPTGPPPPGRPRPRRPPRRPSPTGAAATGTLPRPRRPEHRDQPDREEDGQGPADRQPRTTRTGRTRSRAVGARRIPRSKTPSTAGSSGGADRGLSGIDEPPGMSAGPEPES